MVFQTSLDKPLFGCVWSCLGPRDKLTSSYTSFGFGCFTYVGAGSIESYDTTLLLLTGNLP